VQHSITYNISKHLAPRNRSYLTFIHITKHQDTISDASNIHKDDNTKHKSHQCHKETITQDIRGSPPTWGYVHQLFILFIIFCQYPYMPRASKPTPHRTGDLCAPHQILLPRVRSQHKASLQSLALSFASSQHTVCTKLTQSHRWLLYIFFACTFMFCTF
jgi:hypothetical protein